MTCGASHRRSRTGCIGLIAAVLAMAVPAAAIELKPMPEKFKIYRRVDTQPAVQEDTRRYRSKRTVAFASRLPPGSILIRTVERRLYFILGDGRAVRYSVGVGKEGYGWAGRDRITAKREWPQWRPPTAMLRREEKKGRTLPLEMAGGAGNPLGARALYIGRTEYRIHGTNQPASIGHAVSSGCIRMLNEEVTDLYDRVKIGALVVVE
jgi:lipoprotein-anchoring transpeptidase ErfK/SrfK